MERFYDIRVWLWLALAFVWLWRARLTLNTLWHTPVMVPDSVSPEIPGELISVILPVRNEEKNVRECIERLLAQDYPNLEMVVINNGSTDQTEAILKSMGAVNLVTGKRETAKEDIPLYYINTGATPEGWTGKNFAIDAGVPYARGSWYFFTDADTRHEPASVRTAYEYSRKNKVRLLTCHPRCLARGFFENCIQPAAMGFLGLWFPAEKVNDPASGLYFANGQFILMERSHYEKTGGHREVRGEFLEDFALMKKTRELKAKGVLAFGTNIYGTRMYNSLPQIWRGWRRIYLHAFESRAKVLCLKALSVFVLTVLPFLMFPWLTFQAVAAPEQNAFCWGLSMPILLFILVVAVGVYGVVRARRLFAFLLPLAGLFVSLILLDAARMAVFKKETKWR